MSPRLAIAALLTMSAVLALSACNPRVGTVGPTATSRVGAPTAPPEPGRTGGPDPTAADGPTEPGVIKGLVTTEDGRTVTGARVHILGFTGTAGKKHEEKLTTGADGTYRVQLVDGLYKIDGGMTVDWDGQPFEFVLSPADDSCAEQLSEPGIVADFVLRLSGPRPCLIQFNPDLEGSYLGGVINLYRVLSSSHAQDATVTLTFVPDGLLADGSAGETITMTRTVAALNNSSGSLEGTSTLYDIPLGRYQATAEIETSGGSVPLMLQTPEMGAPAAEADVIFRASPINGSMLDQQMTISEG